MMRRLLLALALCGVLGGALSPPARAWNDMGHMEVAALAYEQLTPAARSKALRLLQLNPAYPQWAAAARGPARDELIFMQAATWADDIQRRPGYINDGEQPPPGPEDEAPHDYTDLRQHRYWHFARTPLAAVPGGHALGPAPTPNMVTQIASFRAALASGAPDGVKSYDLVWLLNLVADAHQPLRAATRVNRAFPHGDDNGRRVLVCKAPCRNSLLDYWDTLPGPGHAATAALQAAHQLPKPFARLATLDSEQAWADDSLLLAQKVVYQPPLGPGAGPYPLDADYHAQALPLANRQLALAAARLARLLNAQLH